MQNHKLGHYAPGRLVASWLVNVSCQWCGAFHGWSSFWGTSKTTSGDHFRRRIREKLRNLLD